MNETWLQFKTIFMEIQETITQDYLEELEATRNKTIAETLEEQMEEEEALKLLN